MVEEDQLLTEKHHLVNYSRLQSLIKAEWSVIRKCQNLVEEGWRSSHKLKKFPKSCCGLLFQDNYAYASNGHYILKIRTDGPSIDPAVKYFFYSYEDDEIKENYNPFLAHVGIGVEDFLLILQHWKAYNLKLRVEDLLTVIEENVKIVRHRREVAFHAGYDSENNELGVRLEFKKGSTALVRLPVYSPPMKGFPEFSVNLSYLHKMIDIISPYYHVVDFCFSGGFDDPLIIKAKNPYKEKPDIRFALGQFLI